MHTHAQICSHKLTRTHRSARENKHASSHVFNNNYYGINYYGINILYTLGARVECSHAVTVIRTHNSTVELFEHINAHARMLEQEMHQNNVFIYTFFSTYANSDVNLQMYS